jgi:tripartite-type tricarboxylate transporter receptor subunit TctC
MKTLFTIILLFLTNICYSEQIEFVISASPGGALDILSRKIEREIELNSSLNLVVISKTGASHNIGYQYIHQTKKPTLFISDISLIRNKNLTGYPNGVVDVVEPLHYIGGFHSVLMVSSKTPIKNYNDFIKLASERQIRMGHGGIGTFGHEAAEEVCKNIDCLMVPYKSSSPGMVDVASQIIDAFPFQSYGAKQLLQSDGNFIGIKEVDFKHWVMLFSKNLKDTDKTNIINILSRQDKNFYENLGVTYANKNARLLWEETLKGK